MTIKELYDRLSDKDFQDPETGSLFFPAYMYIYEPEKEYEIRAEIREIKERLYRPTNYIDVLVLDIFQEFCDHLKEKQFGKQSLFDFLLAKEAAMPQKVHESLQRAATEEAFFRHINGRIEAYLKEPSDKKKTYVFIHGFGEIFPYLRASKFLNNFEKYIQDKYKIILFYPGEATDRYSLFGLLEDDNPYRSIKLIN